jgi:NADH dehydrogenase FAD-containing subunit
VNPYKRLFVKKQYGDTMRVLLAGASLATLAAAARLRRLLPRAEVILINRKSDFLHRRSVPHILSGEHTFATERINLSRFCEQHGVRFLLSEVRGIEPSERVVRAGEQRLSYDALLLDLPDEPSAAHHAGTTTAMPLGGESSAHAIRKHVQEEIERRAKTGRDEHALTVIVGSGVHGIETAAELRALLNKHAPDAFVFPSELRAMILSHEGDSRDEIPLHVRARLLRELASRGVEHREPSYVRYEDGRIHIDGQLNETNSVIWTSSPRGNRVFLTGGIAVDEDGYALVDKALRTSDDVIFALGHSIRKIGDDVLPSRRRGVDLVHEGRVAAHNIAATLLGKKLTTNKKPAKHPRAVTLGKSAVTWAGPFALHAALAYALHRRAERAAIERVHQH